MRNLLFIFLIIPSISAAQIYKRTDTGYSNVFTTTKDVGHVYSKAKEWIATNFNSANDVVQLDTSNKIIVKGKIPFKVRSKGYNIDYIGDMTLTISIKEGRYKVDIDLIGEVYNTSYPQNKTPWAEDVVHKEYSKEEYLKLVLELFDKPSSRAMLTKRQIEKAKKDVIATIDMDYADYKISKSRFDKRIENIFNGIKLEIEAEEEDW